MSQFSNTFNRVASKTKGALSHAFASAALSAPGQMFMRNAGRISGLSFLGGDLLLGIQYAIPAAGFIASDAFLAITDFQNKKPKDILPRLPIGDVSRTLIAKIAPHGLKTAGAIGLMSTSALAYLVRDEPGHVALWTSCAMIAAQCCSWIFEHQFHQLADRASESKSKILSHIFAPLAKYPVLTMTTVDNVGKAIMAIGAIQSGDMKLLSATAIWAIGGNGGVICKDSNALNWIDRKKAERDQLRAPEIA